MGRKQYKKIAQRLADTQWWVVLSCTVMLVVCGFWVALLDWEL